METLTNQVIPKPNWKTNEGNNYGCSWSNRMFWWLLCRDRKPGYSWLSIRMKELRQKAAPNFPTFPHQ